MLFPTQILKIAQETGRSPAQILIAWALQRQTSVVPKTIHVARMVDNIDAVSLSSEHATRIERIAEIDGEVRFLDPSGHIGFDIFSEVVDEPVEST